MDEGAQIRELDQATVERIAAGEVVERPASVVKELVENSLDADANRVEVAVEAGGTEGIRVTDDGVGMTEAEVRRAVRKHTTSKIADIDDLESGLATLGFRGEALHAIGAVSRTTIRTRPRDGDAGTELVLEGGDVTGVEPAGCPEGTTVEVEDLFYNVPARRKYLKQEGTEFAHVNSVVTGYALANPDVAVSLHHDGREVFATTGQGDLRATVMAVYGREVAESMLEIRAEDVPDGPLESVSGLVSHPETNRAGREYCSTYVNGRYVTAATVRDAVVDAYGTQLAPDRYPFAVVFLEVAPVQVDVNVHPRKLEVRFADEAGVRAQVREAVENALLREGLVRSGAPRGRSAPEQTDLAPDSSTEAEDGTDAPGMGADESADERETAARPGSDPDPSDGATDSGPVPDQSDGTPAEAPDSTRGRDHTSAARGTAGSPDVTASSGGRSRRRDPTDAGPLGEPGDPHQRDSRALSGPSEQSRLDGEAGALDLEFDSLPPMRVLGQLSETYVVAETPSGLALVDQHAADERVNYEALRAEFEGETTTQALAQPVRLELTAREAELFEAHGDALARLGFTASRVEDGDRAVEVTTVPSLLAEAADPELVRDVLSSFAGGEAAAAETVEAAADALLADLACHPSVTGNTSLTEGSIVDLLCALDDCENPYACPHGRPVVIELDEAEIEDRFERDYPGHQGRRE